MLETIREYATEKLEASSDADDLRRRHAELFLNLAEEGTFVLMDSTWANRVDSELDNVRSALDFAARPGGPNASFARRHLSTSGSHGDTSPKG